MTGMDQTNAMGGAGGVASPPSELEQAQIICVIGKGSFTLIFFPSYFFPCHQLLTEDFQVDPELARARNAQDWSQISAFRTCPSATFSETGQARCWRSRGSTSSPTCEKASLYPRRPFRASWRTTLYSTSKRERLTSCWMASPGVWIRPNCSRLASVLEPYQRLQ